MVKDCYGVHVSSSYYNGKNGGNGYPVFGYGNAGNSSWMQNSDRVNNFFIENVDNWGFTNVRIGEGESSLKREAEVRRMVIWNRDIMVVIQPTCL